MSTSPQDFYGQTAANMFSNTTYARLFCNGNLVLRINVSQRGQYITHLISKYTVDSRRDCREITRESRLSRVKYTYHI